MVFLCISTFVHKCNGELDKTDHSSGETRSKKLPFYLSWHVFGIINGYGLGSLDPRHEKHTDNYPDLFSLSLPKMLRKWGPPRLFFHPTLQNKELSLLKRCHRKIFFTDGTMGQIYSAFCDDFQVHIWRILPWKHALYLSNWCTGLELQYVCDLGQSCKMRLCP